MSRGNIVASGHKHHHFQHHGVEDPQQVTDLELPVVTPVGM